ncbi:mid1-interacting protein 1 isoform X1 [Manis javanica]|uniref:mid1-interacting protein 1 isoform X1 n=1 Tax=Manis javanica TaxID=9974 RepID=UPI003C6D3258
MPAPSTPAQCRHSPSWPAWRSWLGGRGCSNPPLPCPTPAPSLRPGIRREAELSRRAPPPLKWPRECYSRSSRLGPFISALPGRREEETPGVALSAGDTFPGLYKLSTWDGYGADTTSATRSCSPAADRCSARRQQAPAAGTLNTIPQQGISRRERSQAGVRSKDHAQPIVSFRAPKPEKPRIPGPS